MNNQPLIVVGGVQVETNDEAAGNLLNLIDTLQDINTTTPIAKLNEISMSDNNGKRIMF